MKTPRPQLVPVLAALSLLALGGCYAEVEDPSVAIRKTCTGGADCTFRGVPDALQQLVPLPLASGALDYTLDLGDQDLFKAEQDLGPMTFRGRLSVNEIVVESQDGVPLDGISHLQVSQVAFAGCSADACAATVLASYDRPDATPEPALTRIVLRGNPEVNLLAFGSQVAVRLEAAGRVPAVDWRADLTLNGRLQARADWK